MSTLTTSETYAHVDTHHEHSHVICWRSVLTGILCTLLVYFGMSALGTGIGGFRVAHIIAKNGDESGIFTGAGLWLGLSTVVSLFLGSYFANRISHTFNRKIGAAQGVIIAALFFAWLLHGAGNSMGSLAAMNVTMGGASDIITDAEAEKAARTAGDIGWIFFATFVLGTAASVLAGWEAAAKNVKLPMHPQRAQATK